MNKFIGNLSQRLFWDVDPETIDDRAHCRYVIQRVLERGSLDDLKATVAHCPALKSVAGLKAAALKQVKAGKAWSK